MTLFWKYKIFPVNVGPFYSRLNCFLVSLKLESFQVHVGLKSFCSKLESFKRSMSNSNANFQLFFSISISNNMQFSSQFACSKKMRIVFVLSFKKI